MTGFLFFPMKLQKILFLYVLEVALSFSSQLEQNNKDLLFFVPMSLSDSLL